MARDLIVPLTAHLLVEFLRFRERAAADNLSDEDAAERFVNERRTAYRETADAADEAQARRRAELAADDDGA